MVAIGMVIGQGATRIHILLMPYHVTLAETGDFAFTRLYDRVGADDIVGLLQAVVDRAGPLAGLKVFCDVDDARPEGFTYHDMKSVVSFIRSRLADFAGVRWCNFSTGGLNYGLSRMAGEMTSEMPFEYQVFRDRELAFNWLAVPPSLQALAHDYTPAAYNVWV